MRSTLILSLILLSLGWADKPAHAWNPEGSPVCTFDQTQADAEAAAVGSGETVVVWLDTRTGAQGFYAQRLDADGLRLWPTEGIPLFTTGVSSTQSPDIVPDGTGGAVVVAAKGWATGKRVHVQRIDASGSLLWGPDGVEITETGGGYALPHLVPDGSGGFYVIWNMNGTYEDRAYVQRVLPSGAIAWPSPTPVCASSDPEWEDDQWGVMGDSDGAGGIIVAWTDFRSSVGGVGSDVYAQRIDSTGTRLWPDQGLLVHVEGGTYNIGSVLADGANGAFVSFNKGNYPSTGDPRVQRVDASGTLLWGPEGVLLCAYAGVQVNVQMCSDQAGGIIACWEDERSGGDFHDDIYAQRVDGAGNLLWQANGVPVTTADYRQDWPSIAPSGAGGAYVVWHDERTLDDIYGQYIDATGAALWSPDGDVVCAVNPAGQYHPEVIAPQSGWGPVVTWEDSRNGSSDVYANMLPGLVGDPDSLATTVAPWDAMGQVLVSPGSGLSGVDLVTITVRDASGIPIGNADIEIRFTGCDDLCFDSPDPGLVGTTGDDGVLELDPSVGGCDVCIVELFANEARLRAYDQVVSPDWDGGEADGVVDISDASYFAPLFGGGTYEPCADLDGNGAVSLADGAIFSSCLNVDANTQPCEGSVSVTHSPEVGEGLWLGSQPNPFGAGTTIRFTLPAEGRVDLVVRDIAGRVVKRLVDGEVVPSGMHSVSWDGTDDRGRPAASGIYLGSMTANGQTSSIHMILIR